MVAKARGTKQQGRKRASKAPRKPGTPPPAYFLSLSVENIRCFGPKQILDLSDGKGNPARWTVILGNNGSGKTTLLQSFPLFEIFPEGAIPFPMRGFFESPAWNFSHVRRGATRASMEAQVLMGRVLGGHAVGTQAQLVLRWAQKELEWSGISSAGAPRELVCYGYGATRRMGAGALSKQRESDSCGSLFREDVPLRNAEEWLLQADYGASKKSPGQKQARARRDRIVQVLKDILPEITNIRFVVPTKRELTPRVEFETPYGWVSTQQLSLGYRTLIAWMVDLASRLFERYPDSPNPLAEPAVVLVDEIDLHLHPKWQRRLMSYLSEHFPAAQFIVTAHSPLVVQSAADANIIVLRREGDHVIIDNEVASIRGWRVDQILTSDLFGLKSARPPQLDKLLEERTALLSKPRLTAQDEAKLKELEAAIGPLPAGETATELEALEVIQRFADRVRKDVK